MFGVVCCLFVLCVCVFVVMLLFCVVLFVPVCLFVVCFLFVCGGGVALFVFAVFEMLRGLCVVFCLVVLTCV